MSTFVYYNDDYPDNGGVGFAEFPSNDEAAEYILNRMKSSSKPDLQNYQVIEGKRLKIKAVQVATRIEISNQNF